MNERRKTMRLIDAEILAFDIKVKRDYLDTSGAVGRGEYIALNKALVMIDEQPTIDAVPVVRGEWVWEDSVCSPRTCSVCKQKFYIGRGWNFCPNCGAKMDGKEKEDE